jgi:hypothetical protein
MYEGSPSTLGRSPNSASNVLFSRTMKTTCLILSLAPSVTFIGIGKSYGAPLHDTVELPAIPCTFTSASCVAVAAASAVVSMYGIAAMLPARPSPLSPFMVTPLMPCPRPVAT